MLARSGKHGRCVVLSGVQGTGSDTGNGDACWRMIPTSKPCTTRWLNLFLEDLTVLP